MKYIFTFAQTINIIIFFSSHIYQNLFSGQEGATIDCDEGVPITPFNLEEEMQEGHFDSEGNYFIKKDTEIRDNWLDNIDWVITHRHTVFVDFPSDVYNGIM